MIALEILDQLLEEVEIVVTDFGDPVLQVAREAELGLREDRLRRARHAAAQ